ncbi:MAG TPA: NB-ARC domain-containing protein, partial [Ktedonobacterales bacterium]|nr:NB-ARC domain-containing protein [Ktedonobacterales bacterium]
MRPAQSAHGSPHGGFTQLLAILLGPPGTVLQYCGIGGRLQPCPQRRLLFWANAARTAGNGLARKRARRALLHHGTFDRIHTHSKAASGFSHGLTVGHRSHQSFFQVGRIRTHTCGLCITRACHCFSQVALGGIGKTTLAGVAVRQLQQEGRFPDGIAVVPCQGLTDPAEALRRVLIRFDPLRRAPEGTELSQLQDLAQATLRGKQALVVLDNVEPELPVASIVTPLREAGLTVLVTARQMLPSEAVPVEASRALDLLGPEEALDLFASALGHGDPDVFSPAARAAAEQIVATLGRHTLAVKLAGSYAASERRDLGALARELANPAEGLVLPGDDETPEAVRRSLALSLESLSTDAQRLFAALAAFATPDCGRQAVLALGTHLGQERPERSIHLLVVRALVEPTTSGTLPEHSDRERLRLHPLLRALAELLFRQWPPGEHDAAAQAVAHHFAVYAEDHQYDIAALAADEGNMVGALEWAHTHGQEPLVARLAHGLRQLWIGRGPYREGIRSVEWGVAAAETGLAAEQTRAARQHLAELRLAYGQLLLYTGQTKAGEAELRRSLD